MGKRFPNSGKWVFAEEPMGMSDGTLRTGGDALPVPSLSELIEACGDDIDVMRAGLFYGEAGWVVGRDATSEPNPLYWEVHAFGHTPEEAVARLWLALHPLQRPTK